jgi:hypothetical protein
MNIFILIFDFSKIPGWAAALKDEPFWSYIAVCNNYVTTVGSGTTEYFLDNQVQRLKRIASTDYVVRIIRSRDSSNRYAAPRRSILLCNLLHNNIAGCPQTVQYFCAII